MKSNKIIIHNDCLFLSRAFLIDLGISKNTVKKWKLRDTCVFTTVKNVEYISYNDIPPLTRDKLPKKTEIIAEIDIEERTAKYEAKEKANFFIDAQISEVFKNAIERESVRYNRIYEQQFTGNRKKILTYGIEHAICVACVELNSQQPKVKLKDIHRVYSKLPYKWVIGLFTLYHRL